MKQITVTNGKQTVDIQPDHLPTFLNSGYKVKDDKPAKKPETKKEDKKNGTI